MVEFSKERIEQILYEETMKKAEPETILRSIYTRYMLLYEKYFADIFALDDDKIAELKKYHEETRSLIKYTYMEPRGAFGIIISVICQKGTRILRGSSTFSSSQNARCMV